MPQSRASAAAGRTAVRTNSVAPVRLSRTGETLHGGGPAARHYLEKAADLETRPAHEGAVDVGQGGELADVLGLHAAAIDDVALIGGVAAEPLPDPRADVRVRLAGLRRSRVAPRPDRPDRLVGDDERGNLIR